MDTEFCYKMTFWLDDFCFKCKFLHFENLFYSGIYPIIISSKLLHTSWYYGNDELNHFKHQYCNKL